jgi:cytochrome c553
MRFAAAFAFISLVYASACVAADEPAKPDLERGKQLATTVCGACHGTDGRGTAPTNPNLAGQHADYIAAQLAACGPARSCRAWPPRSRRKT